MTGADLSAQLLSIADKLDGLPARFPPDAAARATAILTGAQDPNLLALILPLAQQLKPDITQAELASDIQQALDAVQQEQLFISSGECARIGSTCRNIAGRPIVCNVIARYLNRQTMAEVPVEMILVSVGLPFVGIWLWEWRVNWHLSHGWSIVEREITPKFLRTVCYVRLRNDTPAAIGQRILPTGGSSTEGT